MKYYIYFDGYEHLKEVISEKDLKDKYNNDPDQFLKYMLEQGGIDAGHTVGHITMLEFNNERELKDYIKTLTDEVTGFYDCESDSRPYNF